MLVTAITNKEFNRNIGIMIDTIPNECSVLKLVKSDVTIRNALGVGLLSGHMTNETQSSGK